jgi:hypothetical protein
VKEKSGSKRDQEIVIKPFSMNGNHWKILSRIRTQFDLHFIVKLKFRTLYIESQMWEQRYSNISMYKKPFKESELHVMVIDGLKKPYLILKTRHNLIILYYK